MLLPIVRNFRVHVNNFRRSLAQSDFERSRVSTFPDPPNPPMPSRHHCQCLFRSYLLEGDAVTDGPGREVVDGRRRHERLPRHERLHVQHQLDADSVVSCQPRLAHLLLRPLDGVAEAARQAAGVDGRPHPEASCVRVYVTSGLRVHNALRAVRELAVGALE